MGAHSLSPCILVRPLDGLLSSAWKRKCALFLCMDISFATFTVRERDIYENIK